MLERQLLVDTSKKYTSTYIDGNKFGHKLGNNVFHTDGDNRPRWNGIPFLLGEPEDFELRPATTTKIGGVIVGENLAVALDGTLSAPMLWSSLTGQKPEVGVFPNDVTKYQTEDQVEQSIEDALLELEHVIDVSYDEPTQKVTFKRNNKANLVVTLPVLDLLKDITYDPGEKKLYLYKKDGGTPIPIDISDLVDTYVGLEGTHVDIDVTNGDISAILKPNCIEANKIGPILMGLINSKISGVATADTTGIFLTGNGTASDRLTATLQPASASVLGGVKQGLRVTIASDGSISANEVNWDDLKGTVPEVGKFPNNVTKYQKEDEVNKKIEDAIDELKYVEVVEIDPLDPNQIKFTFNDDDIVKIPLPILDLLKELTYDPDTRKLVLEKKDGTIEEIPIEDFLKDYSGYSSTTIVTDIMSGNFIRAEILGNSVTRAKLHPDVRSELDQLEIKKIEGIIHDPSDTIEFTGDGTALNPLKAEFIGEIEEYILNPATYANALQPKLGGVLIGERLTVNGAGKLDANKPLWDDLGGTKPDVSHFDNDANYQTDEDVEKAIEDALDEFDCVVDVDYDMPTQKITFKRNGKSDKVITLPVSNLLKNIWYDDVEKDLVLVPHTGPEVRVSVEDLVDTYNGSEGDHIDITIEEGNEITATLKDETIEEEKLDAALKTKINGKINKVPSAVVDNIAIFATGGEIKDSNVKLDDIMNHIHDGDKTPKISYQNLLDVPVKRYAAADVSGTFLIDLNGAKNYNVEFVMQRDTDTETGVIKVRKDISPDFMLMDFWGEDLDVNFATSSTGLLVAIGSEPLDISLVITIFAEPPYLKQ